ncbi:MAG: SHOCT domain-containing protein [Smithellaceae bacterium]
MKSLYRGVTLSALLLLTISCGPHGPMRGWGRMDDYGGGYGFGIGGMFMWLIILIILVAAIYFIVMAIKSRQVTGSSLETPLDILKKRYAKGEITKEDFERMKKDL